MWFSNSGCLFLIVGLVGQGSEEMRAAVGRRLASAEFHSSQVALGDASAGENSPLQSSHRSSRFMIIINTNQFRCLEFGHSRKHFGFHCKPELIGMNELGVKSRHQWWLVFWLHGVVLDMWF